MAPMFPLQFGLKLAFLVQQLNADVLFRDPDVYKYTTVTLKAVLVTT
jgi:hypothetical protein